MAGAQRAARAALLLLLLSLLLACGRGPRVYEVLGVVQEIEQEYRQLVIAHEDIPGLMPAMTMNFDVADPGLLERLEPGQRIRFQLEFTGRSYVVLSAETLGVAEVGAGARLDALVPESQPAPAFELTDQAGARRALADWRGQLLLLDFIFTRCTGPCPILTGTHVQVQRALPEALRGRVHFVSISLDPEHDSPEALRRYARARGADLATWSFLTGEREIVAEVVRSYGVSSAPDGKGQIDHLVATFLIDAEGRIAKLYTGLEHGAEDLLRDLQRVARSSG